LANEMETIRLRLDLRGQVQGVGFRPYVYRLATAHQLAGYVANNSNGAVIEVEGPATRVESLERELIARLPPLAHVTKLLRTRVPPLGESGFRIRPSQADPAHRPEVTPDAATCADCLRELLDPADRRYRYPFINCTNCGPRYSIIRNVPYDRPQTTMAAFIMCPPCAREYSDPADRRFHAQPNACPDCGPRLWLATTAGHEARIDRTAEAGRQLAEVSGADPIREAARLLQEGRILAVKGIGGYHLACRADREDVVRRLRQRKLRDGKPLALMVADLQAARRICRLTAADEETLTSSAAPILLAPKAPQHGLAASVAPGCRDFGIMLPYAPLHHLLFAEGLGPLVMTSANLAGQPLTYRDRDALEELADVADAFLVHDREIFRPVDDSVVFTFRQEAVPVRRARGYAPRPIRLAGFSQTAEADRPDKMRGGAMCGPDPARRILAVGGELKNTVCLLADGEAVVSEHLGDLTRPEAFRHFVQAIDRLKQLCGFEPQIVACDLHPRYLSTEYARRLGLPVVGVQHHHAHIASLMAEWGQPGPIIGLACDGTGLGTDQAIWGCELLLCELGRFDRLGHLEYFPLVGGDLAALETWRPAAALLRQTFGDQWPELLGRCMQLQAGQEPPDPTPEQLRLFEHQAAGQINAPPTSSLGRVFDAVSFLLGLCSRNRHEAEAAMAVEGAAESGPAAVEPLAFEVVKDDGTLRIRLQPGIRELVEERLAGQTVETLAARFHQTVVQALFEAARAACRSHGLNRVGLSGGCFANRRLLSGLVEMLEADGREVLYHRQVPCGDGGLSLGQAVVAACRSPQSAATGPG